MIVHSEMKALSYQDIYLVPSYSELRTRELVDLSVSFLGRTLRAPWIPANMSSVVNPEICKWLSESGYPYIMHRFGDTKAFIEQANRESWNLISISVGVREIDKDLLKWVINAGYRLDWITIDVAHSHSILTKEMLCFIHDLYGKAHWERPKIIAGNVATPKGVKDLAQWGADAAKVGIGGGCFAAGTRILMADGSYKNIEKIQVHDRVIAGDGTPTEVLAVKCSGKRKTLTYRHNRFHIPTICTQDHYHYVHDFSSLNPISFRNCGWAKTADEQKNYRWKQIRDYRQDSLLIPTKLTFELPTTFEYALSDWAESYRGDFGEQILTIKLTPTYELGYLIGAFLGDGHASVTEVAQTDKTRRTTTSKLAFSFGSNEQEIAQKTANFIKNVFAKEAKICKPKGRYLTVVNVYCAPIARFFTNFYKDGVKTLPQDFFINHKDYLKGLIDGLIDSDGCIDNERCSFYNTSVDLIERLGVACYLANGYFPSYKKLKSTAGNLKNCKSENCKESYLIRFTNVSTRQNIDYQLNQMLDITDELSNEIPVYDIEVASETHSFIANNCIVHNSACSTKTQTGFHVPMFTCVRACSEYGGWGSIDTFSSIPIISDGGIRDNGDIAKALVARAQIVMAGSLFAACINAPGTNVRVLPHLTGTSFDEYLPPLPTHKRYHGSSSEHQKGFKKHIEGFQVDLPCNGMTYAEKYQELTESLSSAVSYAGGTNLSAFKSTSYVTV